MDRLECSKLIDIIIKITLICAGLWLLGSQMPLTTCQNPQCCLRQNRNLAWNICVPTLSAILAELRHDQRHATTI